MTKKCGHKIKRILNVGFANGSLDSPLLTRSFIYLKDKQIEVIHENSKNLNQTKLIFQARVRKRALSWGKQAEGLSDTQMPVSFILLILLFELYYFQ